MIFPCERCRAEGDWPTHQHLKFDERVRYLCDACWLQFRQWFVDPDRVPVERRFLPPEVRP